MECAEDEVLYTNYYTVPVKLADAATGRSTRSRSLLTQAGPPEYFLDDTGFGVGIVLVIFPCLCRQRAFCPRVEFAVRGLTSQPITEKQSAIDFRASHRKDVQMNFLGPSQEHAMFVPALFPDAQHVSGGLKGRHIKLLARGISNNQQHVDDGLGS